MKIPAIMKKLLLSDIGLYITALLILADGWFHFYSFPEYIKEVSPDWIIADGLFDTAGLPPIIHRIMGIILITYNALSDLI